MQQITPLHQGISVENMQESISWYQEVLGCEVLSQEFVPFLNATIAFLKLGQFQLELFEYHGEDKKSVPEDRKTPKDDLKTCGTKHVAYSIENMKAFMAHADVRKVDIALPVSRMSDDWVLFIRDNSGTLIELIEVNGAISNPNAFLS